MRETFEIGNAEKSKTMSDNRVLVLKQIEGETVKNSAGITDSRLFNGGNSLRAVKDPQYDLWMLKYTAGLHPVKERFTTFAKLMEFAQKYYKDRGVQIVEVLDAENS